MSKRIRIASLGTIPVAVAIGLWLLPRGQAAEEQAYRTGAVERGTVESVVSATGTLQAVTTVQVGTQVSGQVAALYADFNDAVKKGQLIARIDPTLSEQAVADAEAGLARNQAELTRAQQERDRSALLHESKVVTDVELNTAEYSLVVAKANVRSAEVALARARRNLAYTEIYAPIDGIVVERNVDVGQPVAASLSAPQIFLIAQDLAEMQILASVDESDIAQIREGAQVRFTVQAYQNRTFEGTVRQVRLQSATQENVVSYKAVVAVANPDRALLPGMTATVEFLTAVASDVLTVPNAAVRFQPTEEMRAQLKAPGPGAAGDSASARLAEPPPGAEDGAEPPQDMALLWYLDDDGKLAAQPVRTGISDGQRTEVTGGGLKEGMMVILGTRQPGTSASSAETTTNPFQQQQRRQGPGGGPPGPPGGF
ncbi:MAG: efflux RND transporter periplasmic adaptor subunit [Gemmatimonadetes bacterium]|nr:efflux RND transporter periplasmic adaptor subunit [Gemmatimonadota bacterium]